MNPVLSSIFDAEGVDWLWVNDLPTIRWLTGFSGSTADCLVSASGRTVLFVDFRYVLQAGREFAGGEVIQFVYRFKDLAAWLGDNGGGRIGFFERTTLFSDHAEFGRALGGSERLAPVAVPPQRARAAKSPDEVAGIRASLGLAEAEWRSALDRFRPGMTEREFAVELEFGFRRRGASGSAFPAIVATGPRAAVVHGQPGDVPIVPGSMLLVDFGCVLAGWCSDQTNTVSVGPADDRLRSIYRIVLDAQRRAIDAIRPGVRTTEVDAVARRTIADAGYADYFGHGLGHGVGLEVHELPVLSFRSEETLGEGQVVTVEPGIYLPDWGGVRIEDMVLVTAGGCEVLTSTPRELLELER